MSHPLPPQHTSGQRGASQPTGAQPQPTPQPTIYGPPVRAAVPAGPGVPPQRPKPALNTPLLVIGGALTCAVLTVFALALALVLVYVAQPRIAAGVSVAGIDIGGEAPEDAAAALNLAFATRQLTVTDGVANYPVSYASLGIALATDALLEEAAAAPEDAQLSARYVVDLAQAQIGLTELGYTVNIEAVDGNPPSDGVMIDIPFVLDRLRVDATGELADGVLDLNMIEVEGQYVDDALYSGVTTTYTVQAGDELGLIATRYGLTVNDVMEVNEIADPNLIFVGQALIIPAAGEYAPTAADAPPAPTTSGKSIVVSTNEQRIYAYEHGQLVRSYLVSTGLPATPTVKGDFSIYVKLLADDMRGPDYFLPQVPYTMYYYQGYAIHGTYWHNKFGRPMSHGCVNLPPEYAQWMFDWAEVGTPVRVI